VVGLFAAPMRDLVGVLQARIDQLEAQGGGGEAEAEPAAEEETTEEPEAAVEEGES